MTYDNIKIYYNIYNCINKVVMMVPLPICECRYLPYSLCVFWTKSLCLGLTSCLHSKLVFRWDSTSRAFIQNKTMTLGPSIPQSCYPLDDFFDGSLILKFSCTSQGNTTIWCALDLPIPPLRKGVPTCEA